MKNTQIKVPSMNGYHVENINVIKWLKQEGDNVTRDEVILRFISSLGEGQLTSPVDGVLVTQFYKEGETVTVGELLAEIEPAEDQRGLAAGMDLGIL